MNIGDEVNFGVYNTIGAMLVKSKNQLEAYSQTQFLLNNLESGMYYIKLHAHSNEVSIPFFVE